MWWGWGRGVENAGLSILPLPYLPPSRPSELNEARDWREQLGGGGTQRLAPVEPRIPACEAYRRWTTLGTPGAAAENDDENAPRSVASDTPPGARSTAAALATAARVARIEARMSCTVSGAHPTTRVDVLDDAMTKRWTGRSSKRKRRTASRKRLNGETGKRRKRSKFFYLRSVLLYENATSTHLTHTRTLSHALAHTHTRPLQPQAGLLLLLALAHERALEEPAHDLQHA
jgi:hypothetical protein